MAQYQKIPLSTLLKYYKRSDIQQAILAAAERKEIAISYGGTGYGKRPDVLSYPRDILEMVKQGATSFHCSEELWNNPLQLVTGMRPEDMNDLRAGWDLILDIDCPELEYSKIAAHILIQALRHHGIKTIAVKFSGNHGFHIGVPFEAFPENVSGTPITHLFPEGPRKVAAYLQAMIKDVLGQELLKKDPITTIAQKAKKNLSELIQNGKFNPFEVLAIDTVLIASRHLYRMPYSLNEKSGLVSVVITPEEILAFDKKTALPEKVIPQLKFLDREKAHPTEAKKLLVQAFDFKIVVDVPKALEQKRTFEPVTDAVPEQFFPPCIQKISQGLTDGKKRALFILVNFLASCGWSYDQVEQYIHGWNKKNKEPLRDVYINGQLRHYKVQKKTALPPSCTNKAYMVGINVCAPDGFCPKIKNPAHYAIAKQRMIARMAEEEKPKRRKEE